MGREQPGRNESKELAVISHETKAHSARLWLGSHLGPSLRARRRLLGGALQGGRVRASNSSVTLEPRLTAGEESGIPNPQHWLYNPQG